MKWNARTGCRVRQGFTLIELLVVVSVLIILAAMAWPWFGRVRETGRRLSCVNNERQLGIAWLQHGGERERFDATAAGERWTTVLLPGYRDVGILKCPSDVAQPYSEGMDDPKAVNKPADRAARSYVLNAMDDLYRAASNGEVPLSGRVPLAEPAETVVFGEKKSEEGGVPRYGNFCMSFLSPHDVRALDQARHSTGAGSGMGGSHYTFADGSVRYLRFGRTFSPLNLWATTPEARNSPLAF